MLDKVPMAGALFNDVLNPLGFFRAADAGDDRDFQGWRERFLVGQYGGR